MPALSSGGIGAGTWVQAGVGKSVGTFEALAVGDAVGFVVGAKVGV